MTRRIAILWLLVAGPVFAQDVPPLSIEGNTTVVKIEKFIPVTIDQTVVVKFPTFVKTTEDSGFYFWSYPATVKAVDMGHVLQIEDAPKGEFVVNLKVQSAVYDKAADKVKYVTKFNKITVVVGVPGPVPPKPPDPPVPPVPVPVVSFRVIFVTESGKTLPGAQRAVIDAKVVRDYLTANTTPEGGLAGWRQYDPSQNVTNEQPGMKKLWEATQPSVTTLPCVAIETNGKVDILPLSATPAAQVEVFKAYKAGVK